MTKFDRRRVEIVDVAAHLFATKGYDATSISDLSDAVDLGRGALYHYIESKEGLLAEIHNRAVEPLLTIGRQIADVEGSGALRLRLLSEFFLAVQFQLREHSLVVLKEYRRLNGDRYESYIETQHEFEKVLIRILEDGAADGSLEFDNLFVARMVFLNLHIGTVRWLDPKGPLTASDLSREYCRVLFGGMAKGGGASIERQVGRFATSMAEWKDPRNWTPDAVDRSVSVGRSAGADDRRSVSP